MFTIACEFGSRLDRCGISACQSEAPLDVVAMGHEGQAKHRMVAGTCADAAPTGPHERGMKCMFIETIHASTR
jgi:hypothetical protein